MVKVQRPAGWPCIGELKRRAGDDATLPEWHLRDLRRTAATQMAEPRVPRLHISMVLNHAEGGVMKVYDRSRYEPEKRAALDFWAVRLAAIVEGKAIAGGDDEENVFPFPPLAARG